MGVAAAPVARQAPLYAGHVGIALALRAPRDAPPLWLLVLAAQGPDWLDVVLIHLGRLSTDPAWTGHGFPLVAAGMATAALTGAIVARWRGRAVVRSAMLGVIAYLSHWSADYLTGMKPTWPGGPMAGLALYGRPAADLALESLVVVGGWWLWRRSLPPRPHGDALAWALLAVLLGLQLAADVVMAGGVRLL